MKRLTVILALYAVIVTYPAYKETARVVNAKLDNWASERVASKLPVEVQTSMMEMK